MKPPVRRKLQERGPGGLPTRRVPIAWDTLEDAFENNAPEVSSYLHLETGEVVRFVEGITDPDMHDRVANDPDYMPIDPVPSREQYRWMERFIESVEDESLRRRLAGAIQGRGAFRRFKDVLLDDPVERERWFVFRSARLRAAMEAWLKAHGIEPAPRPEPEVPSPEQVRARVQQRREGGRRAGRTEYAQAMRRRIKDMVDQLPVRELDAAAAFLEFLRGRRHVPMPRLPSDEVRLGGEGSGETPVSGEGPLLVGEEGGVRRGVEEAPEDEVREEGPSSPEADVE